MYKVPKVLFILVLNFLSFSIIGQKEYTGTVYDVGTRFFVPKTLLRSTHANLTTLSDDYGAYRLFLKYGLGDSNNIHFFVQNNSFYWNFEDPISMELVGISGQVLLARKFENHGSYRLPNLPVGYYYLVVQSLKDESVMSLFSDGVQMSYVSRDDTQSPVYQLDTSIVLTKEGYFDREVKLDATRPNQSINILKKQYDSLDYFNELIRQEAYTMLQASPPVTNYGEVQSIKVLYDYVQDKIYYANVKRHPNHYYFAKNILDFKGDGMKFFVTQYGKHPERFLYMASINYHVHLDKYVFEFVSFDQIDCEGVKKMYDKILATSFFGEKLVFYANKQEWNNCGDIPTISSEELFLGQNYQALNLAENFGFLRKLDVAELPSSHVGRHDIILLNDIPNDVSVVAGIITTAFQTPLSHINILSHNRNTPNMALKDGWGNPRLDSLLGELIYLNVESDSFVVRKASLEEATAFWEEQEPHDSIVLEKDVESMGIFRMDNVDITFVKTLGGKAANFGELANLGSIPVPENNFAIPFYYYQTHIEKNGIDTVIASMLVDEDFKTNIDYRKAKLKALRKLIKDSPLDSSLVDLVKAEIHDFSYFPSYRFRSSTNAEDLEGFSGAGLYSSYSAKKNHPTKTIERAIKKVWASLWNLRAFDEREYYKIDQQSIAMGILVHRSFPDEDANGVCITKNLYNVNHGYTFNVQYKEYSIVYPEPGILNDQFLTYTLSLGSGGYTIEYLSHSNVPELNGQTVLTDEEINELADYCTKIKSYYYDYIPHVDCSYSNFAVDLEFKVDSTVDERKIYIKQVRIYAN